MNGFDVQSDACLALSGTDYSPTVWEGGNE